MRRECRERFPRHRLQRKLLVSDPGMHHGTCVMHVPWCMSWSLTRGGRENVPGIPGACAIFRIWQEAHGIYTRFCCALFGCIWIISYSWIQMIRVYLFIHMFQRCFIGTGQMPRAIEVTLKDISKINRQEIKANHNKSQTVCDILGCNVYSQSWVNVSNTLHSVWSMDQLL